MFVRCNTRGKPIQSPYHGSYEVICPGDKLFQLLIGADKPVSVDRLKPAHLDIDSHVQVTEPPNRGHPRRIAPTFGKKQSPKSRITFPVSITINSSSGDLYVEYGSNIYDKQTVNKNFAAC